MTADRRAFLRGGSLGLLGTAFFSRMERVAAMQKGPTLIDTVRRQATRTSEALLLGAQPGEEGPPQPATYDRLPLDWNKRTVARFKELLAEKGVEAFLVRDPLNIIYLTGYWHSSTERPQAVFMNRDQADPWYFYPRLDEELVKTWWFGGGLMYFDYHHADGAYPNQGVVQQGAHVDLFNFMLEGIKKHGIQGRKIGVDGELYPSEMKKAEKVVRDVEWVDVSDTLLGMRMVKTPEELALWRRAYTYFDRAHCYARDYILTHGTDVTDHEVATATQFWINDQLYSDLDLAGGRPHYGVRTGIDVRVRVGPVTAYPHPNQPYYNRISKNMALQVSGIARIGGYGHENYRMYIIADQAGRFDDHMKRLWTVSRDCCDLQVRLSVEGVTCSSVAYQIHKYQVEQGVEQYIGHRPAHGAGVEGHQAPHLSLGDYTMMRRNMTFSEEPGLFDPENGCGFNWSDTVVVGVRSGYRMSRVPYSREWCWIKL